MFGNSLCVSYLLVTFTVLPCVEGNRDSAGDVVRGTCGLSPARHCLKAHTVEDEGKKQPYRGEREILGVCCFPPSAVQEKCAGDIFIYCIFDAKLISDVG